MSDLVNGVSTEELGKIDEKYKFNPLSGKQVKDTPENEAARNYWRKKIEDGRNEIENNMRRAIHNRNMGPLNLLGSKQVAEQIGCSQGTAWLYMKNNIIPSFKIGNRLFTQAWIMDMIRERAEEAIGKGFAKRSYPRMAFKYDNDLPW